MSLREANHCSAFLTASTSMNRLKLVSLQAPLQSCKVLPKLLPFILNEKKGRAAASLEVKQINKEGGMGVLHSITGS